MDLLIQFNTVFYFDAANGKRLIENMTIMVVDVGGTNIRFGVSETVSDPLTDIQSYECSNFTSIESALDTYIDSLKKMQGTKFDAVSIALAAPIFGDYVNVTNNHWQFSKSELFERIPTERVLFINDFVAQALAQKDPSANGNKLIIEGDNCKKSPLLVIGPGTGLGVSALVPMKSDYFVLEGEGGHAHFTPRDELERELVAYLLDRQPYISIEDVISGPGLETIYRFLCNRIGERAELNSAAKIGLEAINGAELPRQAALLFLNALASVIVDNIHILGCWQGAVITGGVVPKLSKLIDESNFKKRIQNQYVLQKVFKEIPVWLSTNPMNGLLGAQSALSNTFLRPRFFFK
ncbi:MAG: ROK family protein [Candidatus Puniceispirillaceae bacterium]